MQFPRLTGAYFLDTPKVSPGKNSGLRIDIIKKEVGDKNNQSPKACILEYIEFADKNNPQLSPKILILISEVADKNNFSKIFLLANFHQ